MTICHVGSIEAHKKAKDMTLVLIEIDDDTHAKSECTALYTAKDKTTVYAWELPDARIVLEGDVIEEKMYRIYDDVYDLDDAATLLRKMFWEGAGYHEEQKLKADASMRTEAFNNWTDMLCKDGDICEDAYKEIAVDGEE